MYAFIMKTPLLSSVLINVLVYRLIKTYEMMHRGRDRPTDNYRDWKEVYVCRFYIDSNCNNVRCSFIF